MSRAAYVSELFFAVTPSDTAPLTDANGATRVGAIRCTGAAGNIVVTCAAGITKTYPILSGETTSFITGKVFATGTTATGLWCFVQ